MSKWCTSKAFWYSQRWIDKALFIS